MPGHTGRIAAMPTKPPLTPERKVAAIGATLALALVGVVGAAQFSNAHDPAGNAG